MKLIEAAGRAYTVKVYETSKTVFTDTRKKCIDFIKAFDKASPDYVDLRLIDPQGKEDVWH